MTVITSISSAALVAGCLGEDPARASGEDRASLPAIAALTSNPAIAGVAGCWRVVQEGGKYRGSLAVQQDGTTLRGFMDWDNHEDALVTGMAGAVNVEMTFTYLDAKTGLVGVYYMAASADGRTLNSTSQAEVPFTMSWIPCQGGCWSVVEEGRKGMVTLAAKDGHVGGFLDWETGADAVLRGTSDGRESLLRATLPSNPAAPARIYAVRISQDGMRTLNGTGHTEGDDAKKDKVDGVSIPCKDASGCFDVQQSEKDGTRRPGRLRFAIAGSAVTGQAEWVGQPSGTLAGDLAGRSLFLRINSPAGNKRYEITVDASGDYLTGATNNGPDQSALIGIRALCPAP